MEQDGDEMWSARCSLSSSVGDESDEQSSPVTGDDVFVAVPEDVTQGMSTLMWAMQNLAKDGSRVVIAHVHSTTRAIHKSKSSCFPTSSFCCIS